MNRALIIFLTTYVFMILCDAYFPNCFPENSTADRRIYISIFLCFPAVLGYFRMSVLLSSLFAIGNLAIHIYSRFQISQIGSNYIDNRLIMDIYMMLCASMSFAAEVLFRNKGMNFSDSFRKEIDSLLETVKTILSESDDKD